MFGIAFFVFSLFWILGLEGLGWGYFQGFLFFDQAIPLGLYPVGAAVGYGVNGGVEAEFRGTNSGLVTKARSLDNLFTSLERLAATLSSVLSWRKC